MVLKLKKKILAAALCLSLLLTGVLLNNKSGYKIVPPKSGHHAIIQIKSNKGLCTAFVVSDKYAFTAGHCMEVTLSFINQVIPELFKKSDELLIELRKELAKINSTCPTVPSCIQYAESIKERIKQEMEARKLARELKPDTYEVIDSNGSATGITAVAIANMDRRDFGLIRGDFRNFEKLTVDKEFKVKKGDKLKACGFPGSVKPAICIDFEAVSQYDFSYAGISMFVPGISGGPVLNSEGVVVGIAVASAGEYSFITPSIGLPDVSKKKD